MTPLVSVLLPTHNRADVLGIAILSVLSQTVKDFELLIVGDGCTDATHDVVASFADPRISWFDLPKAPLSGYANRNIALRQARGQYVAYAQHDDIWFADHLSLLLQAIGRAGADWAYSRPLWVGRSGAIFPSPVNLAAADEFDHFMTVENSVPSTCVMHTRSALERVGYWREDVPILADWTCWRAIISSSAGRRVGHCRSATCLHFPTVMNSYVSMPEIGLRQSVGDAWWPAILRSPPVGRTGQETLWQDLCAGGDAWVSAMRDATDAVIDHVALTTFRQRPSAADTINALIVEAAACRAEAELHSAAAASSREMAGAARTEAARSHADLEIARTQAQAASEAARCAREEVLTAVEEARAARAETAQHREALDQLHRSRSWRLTAPMRAAAVAMRGR